MPKTPPIVPAKLLAEAIAKADPDRTLEPAQLAEALMPMIERRMANRIAAATGAVENYRGIRPCPFCGAAGRLDVGEYRQAWIQCETDFCPGSDSIPYTSSSEALLYWNRRAGVT